MSYDPSNDVYDVPAAPPGPVRLFFRMGGLGIVALSTVVVGLSFWADSQQKLHRAFAEDSRSVQARVTDRLMRSNLNVDGSVSNVYFVDLAFETGDGRRLGLRQMVNKSRFDEVERGDVLPLRYLPGDPIQVMLPGQRSMSDGRSAARAALVLGVVALGLLWRIGGWVVSGVKARRDGPAETATVVGMERSVIRAVDGERYRLVWRGQDGHEGRSLLHKKRDLADIMPGTPITLYRDGPHLWWSGDVGARA